MDVRRSVVAIVVAAESARRWGTYGPGRGGDLSKSPDLVCLATVRGAGVRHPETVETLSRGRAFVDATADMLERVRRIRARRPSPSGRVIPEVDGTLRLTDMYIAPGTIAHSTDYRELAADIMAAIHESTCDAVRQHKLAIEDTAWPEIPEVQWVARRR